MGFATKITGGTGTGQDPRAAYGIYDTEKNAFTMRRVAYDIGRAVQRIVDAGIPRKML